MLTDSVMPISEPVLTRLGPLLPACTDFMAQTGTPRSEIFYTTKLMKNLGYEHVKRSIQRSLDLAGLDYL